MSHEFDDGLDKERPYTGKAYGEDDQVGAIYYIDEEGVTYGDGNVSPILANTCFVLSVAFMVVAVGTGAYFGLRDSAPDPSDLIKSAHAASSSLEGRYCPSIVGDTVRSLGLGERKTISTVYSDAVSDISNVNTFGPNQNDRFGTFAYTNNEGGKIIFECYLK